MDAERTQVKDSVAGTRLASQRAPVEGVGLAFGFSFKALGENLSVFFDFGSVKVAEMENFEFSESDGITTTEGFDLGIGPVGISSQGETSKDVVNGEYIETKTTSSGGNIFNVGVTGTTVSQTKDPMNGPPETKTVKSETISVTQSAKVAFFGTIEISSGVSNTNKPVFSNKNDGTVAADNTRVAAKNLPLEL